MYGIVDNSGVKRSLKVRLARTKIRAVSCHWAHYFKSNNGQQPRRRSTKPSAVSKRLFIFFPLFLLFPSHSNTWRSSHPLESIQLLTTIAYQKKKLPHQLEHCSIMSLVSSSIRLLRILPVVSSTVTLQFAVDEHIFLGTWVHPNFRDRANAHLPVWFYNWGRRGRWVIILGYPTNYALSILNFLISHDQLHTAGSEKWYWLGFMFSLGHMIYGPTALKLLSEIKNDVPKGNSTCSMGVWLKMNWTRALLTDFPAWIFFIVAALKTL
jgi:hypothetical protein